MLSSMDLVFGFGYVCLYFPASARCTAPCLVQNNRVAWHATTEQNTDKAAPPKTQKPNQKPRRGGRALLRPTTDRNPDQKPNQTKPTDRPTDQTQSRTRAGSRHKTAPPKFSRVLGPFFVRNAAPPSSGHSHAHLGHAGAQKPQARGWLVVGGPVRQNLYF